MKGTTQERITKEVMDIAAKKKGIKVGEISFQVVGNFNVLVLRISSIGFLEKKRSTCSWQEWLSDSLT